MNTVTCSTCRGTFHNTCAGITRAQADSLPIWQCAPCLRQETQGDPIDDTPNTAEDTLPEDWPAALADLKNTKRVKQHVPRGLRHRVASELADHITAALDNQTAAAWWKLLSYVYGSPIAAPREPSDNHAERTPDNENTMVSTADDILARSIKYKCADGDVRGALRLLTCSDNVATPSKETTAAIQAKHPAAPPDDDLPPDVQGQHVLHFTEQEVHAAVRALPPGSAAGPDGIRAAHILHLIQKNTAEAGVRLLSALTALCNVAAAGNIPDHARKAFFSARLVALRKKDGGVRPIAIGTVYRRLVCKLVARRASAAVAEELRPVQLGVGTQLGCEAAVHAIREYAEAHNGTPNHLIVKLDIKNAFNAVNRSAILREIQRRFPAAAPLAQQAYSQPSPLYLGTTLIWSCRGVQQGDPLGPLLFSLAIDPIIHDIESQTNVWYLDDATLAGPRDTIVADLNRLIPALRSIGLELNYNKCELTDLSPASNNITTSSHSAPEANHSEGEALLRQARITPLKELMLLGAPIQQAAINEALHQIRTTTETLIGRTEHIGSHAALFFLSRYASVPRSIYLMRATPTYMAENYLEEIDNLLREAIANRCNIALSDDAWIQASLPLRQGGIGARRMADVALPAFIASMEATRDLVSLINRRPNGDRPALLTSAIDVYTAHYGPLAGDLMTQRHLDETASEHRFQNLLESANQVDRARLVAAASPHSGAWLSALPAERLGLLLPDDAVRVGVALRLGCPVQHPHRCRCGTMTDKYGHHNLSCRYDPGRLPRHKALNDTVFRGLAAAGLAAILEPRGLDRGDGRRPDGSTIYPYRRGRMLLWDATCTNTFSTTHLMECAVNPGAAARAAEDRKRHRYDALSREHEFVPLAIETTGVLGPAFEEFVRDLGRRIREKTGERRETEWLRQRISLAVVRGNAAAITIYAHGQT